MMWVIKMKGKRMEVQMTNEMTMNIKKMGTKMGEHIVRELSNKYGFSGAEALEYLNLSEKIESSGEKKEKSTKKSGIPLPFCGVICNKNCEAIRLNHGLYTQCTNEKTTSICGHNVCTTCDKQIEKNSNRMPTYGYISDRIAKGDEFRDPKGKAPTNYGNVMEKLNISRNAAEREAANQGVTIPEEQFEVKKARRGRPKKDTTAIDTSGSEEETLKPEKKRGRPKKDKPVSNPVGDDLIKDLVKAVNIPQETTTPSSSSNEVKKDKDDDDDNGSDDGTEVEKVVINGKEYLKSESNIIYDVNTWDEIGVWNEKSKSIEPCEVNDD
jgi:hypothetical protein